MCSDKHKTHQYTLWHPSLTAKPVCNDTTYQVPFPDVITQFECIFSCLSFQKPYAQQQLLHSVPAAADFPTAACSAFNLVLGLWSYWRAENSIIQYVSLQFVSVIVCSRGLLLYAEHALCFLYSCFGLYVSLFNDCHVALCTFALVQIASTAVRWFGSSVLCLFMDFILGHKCSKLLLTFYKNGLRFSTYLLTP